MQVTRVTVSFSGKIPTQSYGSIDVNVIWGADLEEGESPEEATRDLFARVRNEVTEAVRPIAQAKLVSAEQALRSIPHKERDAFMSQFGVIQWLNTVVPEVHFANQNGSDDLQEIVDHAHQGTDNGHSDKPDNGAAPAGDPA